ncbi:Phosphoethanolamine transferase for glucans (OPG), alkaline phosphatase superfamily [Chitinophaga jiangningensis]|uniref:Phosphoethanolamine transferase for glucans (OPG), alkaline phosphatase superfamily n=1 Tax=Chitinophaga jiangningensis TaxID=1419482 RepID=A0A1M7LPZ6_9BACT|nr:phosphoethanolamine transferase [Chitinophaga jiangningensis]SHM79740.1 Phosphoethanolamine transferase for glucans (OPG), alkaline phosphatase superfamily [Chitinophaga jiangningensis]
MAIRLHWNRQSTYLLIFAISWVIPNMVLVWIDFSWFNIIVNLLFPFTLGIALISVFRKPGIMMLLMLPMLIIHAYEIVFLYLFGEGVITTDMFLNTVTTDVEESTELLGNIMPSIIIVCVLYLPILALAILSCCMKMRLHAGFRRQFSLYAGIASLVMAGIILVAGVRMDEKVYPLNVIYNLNFAVDKWYRERNYPITSYGFTFHANKKNHAKEREVYVLVLGESSRAMSWSLLGHRVNTNPFLTGQPGLLTFSNITSESNATQKSVPLILSPADASSAPYLYTQKSIITLFKEAGFKTYFITNQVANQQLIGFYSKEANVWIDINKGVDKKEIGQYDANLIPHFKKVLDEDTGKAFVVLHMHGSHFKYSNRYPTDKSFFKPDQPLAIKLQHKTELWNAYDNSIRYSDSLLHVMIGMLQERELCAGMLYVSDHGENLMDDDRHLFLHSTPFPTYYELRIPLLLWFSRQYLQTWPERFQVAEQYLHAPADTRVVFHTLADMAGIYSPFVQYKLSLTNQSFEPQIPRRILGDHEEPEEFSRYFKTEDFDEMQREDSLLKR